MFGYNEKYVKEHVDEIKEYQSEVNNFEKVDNKCKKITRATSCKGLIRDLNKRIDIDFIKESEEIENGYSQSIMKFLKSPNTKILQALPSQILFQGNKDGEELDDFRKDALATALHVYYLNRKYPHAELSLSCPRLRPIINNDKINPRDVGEKQLCQVLCAYRLFLPFVGITVSSRESAQFRNGITKICATKVSAGVSTGIGDHESKYTGKEDGDAGDEQFEINDNRSFDRMYKDMEDGGLQPVVNEYIYV